MRRRRPRDVSRRIIVRLVKDFDWDLLENLLTNITIRGTCWIRGKDQSVYTQVRDGNRLRQAHRVSYELFNGKRLKHQGCHNCDVKACINPEHIFDGTPGDNVQDARNKGRLVHIRIESSSDKKEKIKIICRQQMNKTGPRHKANLTREEIEYKENPLNLSARLKKLTESL